MITIVNESDLLFRQNEQLDEAVIYRGSSKKNNYCIFSDVQKNRNFDKDPYIKVYNNSEQKRATEVIRISMKDGRAIYHRNTEKDAGKKDLRYTKELAKFLTDAMNQPHCSNQIKDPNVITVYDAIYYSIGDMYVDYIKYPIPNFMEAYNK